MRPKRERLRLCGLERDVRLADPEPPSHVMLPTRTLLNMLDENHVTYLGVEGGLHGQRENLMGRAQGTERVLACLWAWRRLPAAIYTFCFLATLHIHAPQLERLTIWLLALRLL